MRALALPMVMILGVGALAGCPGTDSNPPVLWLALDGDELHVKLIESQPRPY